MYIHRKKWTKRKQLERNKPNSIYLWPKTRNKPGNLRGTRNECAKKYMGCWGFRFQIAEQTLKYHFQNNSSGEDLGNVSEISTSLQIMRFFCYFCFSNIKRGRSCSACGQWMRLVIILAIILFGHSNNTNFSAFLNGINLYLFIYSNLGLKLSRSCSRP